MARRRAVPSLFEKAAQQVRKDEVKADKPKKRIVTLYLDESLYERLQEGNSRKVSQVIEKLIRAYLEARDGDERPE